MNHDPKLVEAVMKAVAPATPIENALVDGWEAMAERFPTLEFQSCREAQDAAATAIVAFLRGLARSGDWVVTPSTLADQVEEAARPGAKQDGEPGW